MATITDKETVDILIKNNGIYPGDEAFPVVKIVQYENAFDGGIAYGLIYKDEPLNKYDPSPFILNPRQIFPVERMKAPFQEVPSMDQLQSWMMEDGGCEATDGCWVEPDGTCEHGKPSWMIKLGLI